MQSLRRAIPSPTSLFAFEAAARLGSFTLAALELNVSQAAVSAAVRRLEQDLGTTLFVRAHRRIALTDNGRKFFGDVSIGLSHICRSADDLRRLHASGHVTLSVSTAFASYWMLPRLVGFKQRFPNIDMRLQTSDKDVDLTSEGISLGIRRGHGDWEGYAAALFEAEEIDAVCSPAYLEQVGPLDGPESLLRCRLLHLDEPFRPRPTWSDWLARFGVAYTDRGDGLRLNDYALVIHAALAGEGIIMGWRHLTEQLVREGRLVRAVEARYRSEHGFYVVWPRHLPLTDDILAIRDWLVEEGSIERPAESDIDPREEVPAQ
jgi:DNA-binding transcriptional LysR family regulator